MIGSVLNGVIGIAKVADLRLRLLILRLRYPSITIGKNVVIDRNVFIRALDGGSIRIGDNTHIWRGCVIEARGGTLTIGRNSLINAGTVIITCDKVDIGEYALIAEHVTIRDQDHEHDLAAGPYAEQGRLVSPVEIGANVWIGAKVTITRGVTIAPNSVIGSNSVVTKSLGGSQKFAGVPAKPI